MSTAGRAPLSPDFDDALVFASRLHAGQTRKGTQTPYIAHLLAVAALVIEHGGDEDEAIAALLHDAVEDQGGQPTLDRIRRRFGERVAAIVAGCTDTDVLPKPPWCARKTAFIRSLQEGTPSVHLVAAADKLHNARAVLSDLRANGEVAWSRFHTGRDGTLWYYRAVTSALQDAKRPGEDRLEDLIAELDQTVTTLERESGGPGPADFCG